MLKIRNINLVYDCSSSFYLEKDILNKLKDTCVEEDITLQDLLNKL